MPKYRSPLTCEQLLEMSQTDREHLSEFAAVLEGWSGSTSPAEELIINLVSRQADDDSHGITPESLTHAAEEFANEFEAAIDVARALVRKYPAQVLGVDCGYWNDQIAALKEGRRGDEQQEAITLEEAREALRKYPSLLVTAKVPEPWRAVLIETHGAEAEEHLSRIEEE